MTNRSESYIVFTAVFLIGKSRVFYTTSILPSNFGQIKILLPKARVASRSSSRSQALFGLSLVSRDEHMTNSSGHMTHKSYYVRQMLPQMNE